jgi:hypothetical protein
VGYHRSESRRRRSGSLNVLYSTQVTIEDLDSEGNVKSKVAVDFFIQLVTTIGFPPVFNAPDPTDPDALTIVTFVGDTVNFPVSVKPGEEPEPECGAPGAGDCCEAHETPYCDDQDCCEFICAFDPFCCDTEWDSLCADQANDECAVCDTTQATPPMSRPSVNGGGISGLGLDAKTSNTGGINPPGVSDGPNISDRLLSVPIGGNGPDPDELTLNVVGLPPGAVMDPELPLTDVGGVSSMFTWTPEPGQDGTYIVTFTASAVGAPTVSVPVTIIVKESAVVCGDLNFDDIVDNEDLVLFMDAYGSCNGDPHFNPLADYNGDGCVGMADLAIWYECYLCFLDPNCPEEE